MMRNSERAGSHHPSKEAMEANLSNEVDKVRGQTEGHAACLSLKVGCLDLLHRPASKSLLEPVAGLEPRITETKSPSAFAEACGSQVLEFCLVKGIREEGVCSMVRRKPLLEQEEVVNVVENSMEI